MCVALRIAFHLCEPFVCSNFQSWNYGLALTGVVKDLIYSFRMKNGIRHETIASREATLVQDVLDRPTATQDHHGLVQNFELQGATSIDSRVGLEGWHPN